MNNPTVVYLISGIIGVVVGLWVSASSLPLLLHREAPLEAETKLQSDGLEALTSHSPDIVTNLKADFAPREAIAAQPTNTPEAERSIAPIEVTHAGAPAAAGPTVVVEAEARQKTQPDELTKRDRIASLNDAYMAKPSSPAPAIVAPAPRQEATEPKIAPLNSPYSANPSPQVPAQVALAPRQEAKDPVTEPVVVKLPEMPQRHPLRQVVYAGEAPALPERHPFREVSYAASPSVQEPRVTPGPAAEPEPRLASNNQYFLPFLSGLWKHRTSTDAASPAPGMVSPTAASPALVRQQSPAPPSQERYYAPRMKWEPPRCNIDEVQ